jgi:type IV secretion system protein VirB9
MKKIIALLYSVVIVSSFGLSVQAADIPVPVATDSRIKTFVYTENDVYGLLTHYGYQCNIEFSPQEEIETISIGDRVGWQVIPAGRRVFIRAMEEHARTNMTVVTNRRAYQFDLRSTSSTVTPNEELVYVVRFFYPDDRKNRLAPAPYSDDMPPVIGNTMPVTTPPAIPAPQASVVPSSALNYNYTFTGPDALAPTKLFDDGNRTYFKFKGDIQPAVSVVLPNGKETPVRAQQEGEYLVIDSVASRFSIRSNGQVICIYNELLSPRSGV